MALTLELRSNFLSVCYKVNGNCICGQKLKIRIPVGGRTAEQQVKHAASCSAEQVSEVGCVCVIKLWAAQLGEGASLCMQL